MTYNLGGHNYASISRWFILPNPHKNTRALISPMLCFEKQKEKVVNFFPGLYNQ